MPGTLFAVPDTHDKDLENLVREDIVDACVSVRLHVPPGFVVGCPIVACVLHIFFLRFFVV